MDGFSYDGFHAALVGRDREYEPRQRACGRLDATGAPIGPDPASLVGFDGWMGGLSGQHSTRLRERRSKKMAGVGRAALEVWPQLHIGTVIKRTEKKRVVEI